MFHLFITLVTSYFYPRPPRGGRRKPLRPHDCHRHDFYPRPPRGGRPPTARHSPGLGTISIHALREEGDQELSPAFLWTVHFYPRPLRGGRLLNPSLVLIIRLFLSTPSARRATTTQAERLKNERISIHALCEEGDARP